MMKNSFIVTPTRVSKRILTWVLAVLALSITAPLPQASANLAPTVDKELECLALTLYHEARGEPDEGKIAVGYVVLNRVADERYPDNICGVVKQGGQEVLNRCQFSWWCDGQSDHPANAKAWKRSVALARAIFWGYTKDPTQGAVSYHATYVKPGWRKKLVQTVKIGQHIFYSTPEAAADKNIGQPLAKPGLQTANSN